MTDTNFSKLRLSHAHGVMTIAIDNPPVNVLDVALMSEISRLLLAVRDDPDTRVLVFQSANPEFFIAHVDMTLIDEPHAFDELASNAPEGLIRSRRLANCCAASRRLLSLSWLGWRAAAAPSLWRRPIWLSLHGKRRDWPSARP